jgi:hypothetical protein
MMPCNICTPLDENGNILLSNVEIKTWVGLKQKGKTKCSDANNFERIYVFQLSGSVFLE